MTRSEHNQPPERPEFEAGPDPDRLFEICEAVLRAVTEVAEMRGGTCPYPPDLMGSADQPDELAQFTLYEVEQATLFLIRMGLLQPRPARDSAS